MPAKFDFLSPGVLLREIDQSQVPVETTADGLLLVGPAPAGPALKPVRVKDLDSFLAVFGNPISGKGTTSDVWRNGSLTAPTYAMYAAQAWLASETSPVTFVRLLGQESDNAQATGIHPGYFLPDRATAAANVDSTDGGAYGLWLCPSASENPNDIPKGTLAAMFYVTNGALRLTGSTPFGNNTASCGVMIESLDSGGSGKACEFKIQHTVDNSAFTDYVFHFDNSSGANTDGYIRKVFNTNPQKTNDAIAASANLEQFWLGETFEENVQRTVLSVSGAAGDQFAFLAHMGGNTNLLNYRFRQRSATAPKTGWFFAQDNNENIESLTGSYIAENQEKLFRFCSHHEGEWLQKNYQLGIEISRLGSSISPYASFHVYLLDMQGNKVEQYKNCNLNPGSESYIGKKIGDQYQVWNKEQKKYDTRGNYENRSDYIYVEVATNVANNALNNLSSVPFGYQGPVRHSLVQFKESQSDVENAAGSTHALDKVFAMGSVGGITPSVAYGNLYTAHKLHGAMQGDGVHFEWPSLKLTTTGSKGSSKSNYAASDFLGVNHCLSGSDKKDASYIDIVRNGPFNATNGIKFDVTLDENGSPGVDQEFSFVFSLDDVVYDTAQTGFYHLSGSRKVKSTNNSVTSVSGTAHLVNTLKVRKFKAPFFGGADGLDVTEPNAFCNRILNDSTNNQEGNNYAVFSFMKALDTIRDPEVVKYDMISAPGVTSTKITDEILNIAAERGDSLAIIDIENGFSPGGVEGITDVVGSVKQAIDGIDGRQINTSYGATYYPHVRMRDTLEGQNNVIMAPPSIAALGAIARSEALSEPWFAPAGFNRGGLSQLGGILGPQVVGTWEHLTKQNRDDLYDANINPIARFPAINEIVIFGQKTLQQTPSALDRINVRRLMIFLKKAIGQIADSILFDQNVNSTWLRFKTQAEAVLNAVQTRLGITEYKLVLDDTTTTPDLIDRNILYAKVFVKPARSIEFIVVDFIITRTGVEF